MKSADFSKNLPLKIPQNFHFFSANYQKPCNYNKNCDNYFKLFYIKPQNLPGDLLDMKTENLAIQEQAQDGAY